MAPLWKRGIKEGLDLFPLARGQEQGHRVLLAAHERAFGDLVKECHFELSHCPGVLSTEAWLRAEEQKC